MLVDIPQIDWLTVTTYDREKFNSVMSVWHMSRLRDSERYGDPVRVGHSKVMQYKGRVICGVFFGVGTQRDRDHYMVRVSGSMSQVLFSECSLRGFRVTRVDVQLTVDQPVGYNSLAIRRELLSAKWNGRRPSIRVIATDNGMDTVYIGSRSSETMVRMYVKKDSEGYRYVRYEIEMKGERARSAFQLMDDDWEGAICGILRDSMDRIPYSVPYMNGLRHVLRNYENVRPRGRVRSEATSRVEWLMNMVEPAIIEASLDHDTSEWCRQWVESLYKRVCK